MFMILCSKPIAKGPTTSSPGDLFFTSQTFPLLAFYFRLLPLVLPQVVADFAIVYRVQLAVLLHHHCCDVEVIETSFRHCLSHMKIMSFCWHGSCLPTLSAPLPSSCVSPTSTAHRILSPTEVLWFNPTQNSLARLRFVVLASSVSHSEHCFPDTVPCFKPRPFLSFQLFEHDDDGEREREIRR